MNNRSKINYLGALGVLSLMSILLATGFIENLSAEKSEGRIANPYGSATKGKVCGDQLCSETGGKIILPWEKSSNTPDQICYSLGEQVPCEETEEVQIEEETKSKAKKKNKEQTSFTLPDLTAIVGTSLPKANVPITIPLHLGYFEGNPIYYIITDSSDPTHADIITKNHGWKVNHAPLLANATEDALSKTYIFTNGVPGDGVNGFQGELFSNTPAQTNYYSALTSTVNVTWNDGALPIILDSEKELVIAIKRGFVTLNEEVDVVFNMPQIVWADGQMPVKVNSTITDETLIVGGQLIDIDLENKTTTFIARSSWDSEGRPIYFIIADGTPVGPALNLGVPHAPKNGALISNPAAADMFQFLNGIEGSGPLGFQAGIVSASPGDAGYSPMSRIYFISWNDPDDATLLQSKSDIDQFEEDELITITLGRPMAADHVANTPIVEPILNKSSILE